MKRRPKPSTRANFGGIDPGKRGFLVVYDGKTIVRADPMPFLGKEPDTATLRRILAEWSRLNVVYTILEKQQPFARDTAVSAFAIGRAYGHLEMILATSNLPHEIVAPADWKRRLKIPIPKAKKDRDKKLKALATAKAQRLGPSIDFRANTEPGSRCRVAHDGKVEAFLLAVLAYRTHKED